MEVIEKVLSILEEELVPAEGCTEPIAIAYAAAKLTNILGNVPEKIDTYLSGNIVKNVKSVKIPNSDGMVGIEASTAMGAILGDSSKELMVIAHVDKSRLPEVKKYIEDKKVNVFLNEGDIKLYIRLEGTYGNDTATVEIQHYHTNITKIIKNGVEIKGCSCDEVCSGDVMTDRTFLSVELIYNLAKTIDLSLIEATFQKVIDYNSAIANEGLTNTYGIAIGKTIKEGMEEGVYGNDLRNKMASFTSAGSDARIKGCSLPVITTSGSGNQGMTASLPTIVYAKDKGLTEDEMYRALILASLVTIHQKTFIGRLSAYCGAVSAACGSGAALTYMKGGTLEQIENTITNTLANIAGIVCDGAKASCAAKIASSLDAAIMGHYLAMRGVAFDEKCGMVQSTIEQTIEAYGRLGREGMKQTDIEVLNIMLEK